MEEIELLVTEVVTNAVIHGPEAHPGGIGLDILEFDDMLRIEVRDQGPGFTPSVPERPSLDGEGGRGLYLIDAVADRWGVNGDGVTLVWFELAIDRTGSMSNGYGEPSAKHVLVHS